MAEELSPFIFKNKCISTSQWDFSTVGFLCLKHMDTFGGCISGHHPMNEATWGQLACDLWCSSYSVPKGTFQQWMQEIFTHEWESNYCAFTKILCTSSSAASPQSFVVSLPSQHTGICSHKPQLLLKAIFSAGLPTCPCKISQHLSKGCVLLCKISGTHHCTGSVHLGQHRSVLKSHHKKGSERKDERINAWQIPGGHSLRG